MSAGVYHFTECTNEDTVPQTVFTFTETENDVTTDLDLTGTTITMTIKNASGTVLAERMTTDSEIIIATNVVTVLAFNAPSEAGAHTYDIQVDFPDGTRKTYLRGKFPVRLGVTDGPD